MHSVLVKAAYFHQQREIDHDIQNPATSVMLLSRFNCFSPAFPAVISLKPTVDMCWSMCEITMIMNCFKQQSVSDRTSSNSLMQENKQEKMEFWEKKTLMDYSSKGVHSEFSL